MQCLRPEWTQIWCVFVCVCVRRRKRAPPLVFVLQRMSGSESLSLTNNVGDYCRSSKPLLLPSLPPLFHTPPPLWVSLAVSAGFSYSSFKPIRSFSVSLLRYGSHASVPTVCLTWIWRPFPSLSSCSARPSERDGGVTVFMHLLEAQPHPGWTGLRWQTRWQRAPSS